MLDLDFDTYEDLHDDPRYAARMRTHAQQLFNGKPGVEVGDEVWGPYAASEADDA